MYMMYDNTDLSLIPANPHAVACYRNGRYANENEARRRFPHARILPISVQGWIACDAYDVEHGDYTVSDVPRLYEIARDAGIWRPCFYAQLSGIMPAVRNALRPLIKNREDVRLWVAYYDGIAHLPAEYDAHQFTDRALGRSLDESICADTFFKPMKTVAPAPEPKPPVKDRAIVTYEAGAWAIDRVPSGVRDA